MPLAIDHAMVDIANDLRRTPFECDKRFVIDYTHMHMDLCALPAKDTTTHEMAYSALPLPARASALAS